MPGSINLLGYGSLLLESPLNESEADFRAYVTSLLTEIYGQLPDWLSYKVGGRFERGGVFYRAFLCPSGSVDSRIQMHAGKPGGMERVIVLRGSRSGQACCSEIRLGIETEFDCAELRVAVNAH